MSNIDLYGYGPLIKGLSLVYLAYMVLYNNLEIPWVFFILYGIGSFAFVTHLLAVKEMNQSVVLNAGIYEQYFNIVICLYVAYFLYSKK